MALSKKDLSLISQIVSKEVEGLAVITKQGFDAVDKRFEAVDKRFEAVDKRFNTIDKRFEANDKSHKAINQRIDALGERMDRGFQQLRIDINSLGLINKDIIQRIEKAEAKLA